MVEPIHPVPPGANSTRDQLRRAVEPDRPRYLMRDCPHDASMLIPTQIKLVDDGQPVRCVGCGAWIEPGEIRRR